MTLFMALVGYGASWWCLRALVPLYYLLVN